MGPDQPRRLEIRFILRHSLILIGYIAFLFKIVIPALELTGHRGVWNLLMPTLLVSPPLLAFLVVIIGRAGPMKNWCVSFLLFLFYPAVVLNHDRIAVLDYVRDGRPPTVWVTLLLNSMIAIFTLWYVGKMAPRLCPGCHRRRLIPLMQLSKTEDRSSNTCWCASCGGKYWKDREGNWRVERRTTWFDRRKERPTLGRTEAPPGGRFEVPEPPGQPLGPRAANEIHAS